MASLVNQVIRQNQSNPSQYHHIVTLRPSATTRLFYNNQTRNTLKKTGGGGTARV